VAVEDEPAAWSAVAHVPVISGTKIRQVHAPLPPALYMAPDSSSVSGNTVALLTARGSRTTVWLVTRSSRSYVRPVSSPSYISE